jgi:Zn-dependent protease/CBS domain-containing protein
VLSGNISLGRIGGVEVRINWSWLVIFALIVWTLADGVFPSTNPGLSGNTHLAMAIVAALLFVVSILLHELGHAWEARREGLEVDGITLWLFGGVSQFKGGFPSAGAEFRIAIAGPLVSLVLGVVFVLIAIAGVPSAVDGVAAWLGYINLALLVFNLIPALPSTGARAARGAVAEQRRPRLGNAGRHRHRRIFGYLFIGLDSRCSSSRVRSAEPGLRSSAGSCCRPQRRRLDTSRPRPALHGLRVRDLMVRDPVTVDGDLTVGQFMDEVARSRRFTTYPVVDGGRPIGLLAFGSVAALPRSEWDSRHVREAMLPLERVPLLTEDETAIDALTALSSPTSNRGLVVENGHLAGLLSITDLTRALELRRSRPSTGESRPKLGV